MKRLLPIGLLLAVLAGCSGAHSTRSAATGGAHPSGRAASDPSSVGPPIPTPGPTSAAGGSRQRQAGGALVRDGKTAKPAFSAAPAPFDKAISYSDGIKLKITHVAARTETGEGVGARPGDPVSVFTVRITNNSAASLDLNQVVVNLDFDNGRMQAQPVYSDGTNDFSGSVASHSSMTTSYAFTIPTTDLGAVAMTVDFDGRHAAATFTGSVR